MKDDLPEIDGWNYRVMRRTHERLDMETYAVYEVYYNADGEVTTWTETPVAPRGDTLEELKEDIAMQALAFDKPVLDYNELDKMFEKELDN